MDKGTKHFKAAHANHTTIFNNTLQYECLLVVNSGNGKASAA